MARSSPRLHLTTAAEPSGYRPIADHGVIGDLRSVALVGTDGAIDWFCCPRFDAPSVFGSILDVSRGGHYRIAAVGRCTTKQLYIPDTAVLVTRFLSSTGIGEVQDFMPVGEDQPSRLIRRVVCVAGRMRFRLECEPRFDYGRAAHTVISDRTVATFASRNLRLELHGPTRLTQTQSGVQTEFELSARQTATFVLGLVDDGTVGEAVMEGDAGTLLDETVDFWRDWLATSTYRGRWREMVNRSALTLKLLTYAPSGAIVAAPTTSLPEQLGGARNWDYRFTWVRDSAFTLYALLRLGFTAEAQAYGRFLYGCFQSGSSNGSGPLQLMYGIDGRTSLPEETLEQLEGYRGSGPVRVGNGAHGQLQLDIYGEIIDAAYLAHRDGGMHMPYDTWRALADCVDWLCENWDQPDEGIWETRGGRQRFTYSRVMSWVAIDRAIRIARERALPAEITRWTSVRDLIYQRVMERCWSEKREAFVQYEGADVLDASLLLMPLVAFISPTDPRWLSTLEAIGAELVSDSLVYRYNPGVSPDGLGGSEGTFSICSFWFVEALARAGRLSEARLAFEKTLTYANHLGLYSEEIGLSGELLGNFPQAFTHLALISAAVNLDRQLG
jgi:GH15 family glucan-1,4-alpha-glucosidase